MNPFRNLAQTSTSQHRRSLIAKVHIAQKQLGLNEDDYRAILVRETGHSSTTMMNENDLIRIVHTFERQGFTAKAKRPTVKSPAAADHPSARKARAMWISLAQLGAVRDPSERALESFARRQLNVAKLQWADQGQCYKLVEALKAIAERAGWSQDMTGVRPHAIVIVLKRRLVDALLAKLKAAELIPPVWDIERAAWELAGERVQMFSAGTEQLEVVARTFAEKLAAVRNSSPEHA